MQTLLQEPTVEKLDSSIEDFVRDLDKMFESTFAEVAEIETNGFSFTSSLKDISRYIIINLLEQTNDLNQVKVVMLNWNRYVKALTNPDLITTTENFLFEIFTIVFFNTIDYFKKQFGTHLGEKVELDESQIEDPNMVEFIKKMGFRQRKFEYTIQSHGEQNIQQVTASTTRSFERSQKEREQVELLNSFLLRILLRPEETPELVTALVNKFPELERQVYAILSELKQFYLKPGDNLIEISPPFENYSYQNECMVRIYTYTGTGFVVTQYSIPFVQSEIRHAIQGLIQTYGAQQISTNLFNEYDSNAVLSNFFVTSNTTPASLLNVFPSIVEVGGSELLEKTNDLILPQIQSVTQKVDPFIAEYVSTPCFTDPSRLEDFASKYSEIFLSAVATLDKKTKIENPEISSALESGNLLTAAVSGSSTAQVLSDASGGAVTSLSLNFQGYCDNVSGTIGGAKNDQKIFTALELEQMKFEGKVMSLTHAGDLNLDLLKFRDSNGAEKKVFACPTCAKNGTTTYIDICADSCPKCSVSLTELRLASERSELGKYVQEYGERTNTYQEENSGIFDVLFSLFGAVFNIF